jgi:hypothetical protein
LDRIRYYLCVSSFSPLLWKGILPPNIEVLSLLLLHGRVSIKDFIARRILLTIFQQVVPFLTQKKKQLSIFSLHCYETWKVWNHFILWIGLQWCMLKFLESLMMQWKIQIEASFNKKKTYPENDVYAMLKLFFSSKVKDRCLCKYLTLIFLFNFVVFNLFSLKNS